MKFLKTLILWILALQLLNMSICSEAYWFYYNDGVQMNLNNSALADPTETIVELLVEMRLGQQEAFTYDQHNIDPKNTSKAMICRVDLENDCFVIDIVRKNSEIYFTNFEFALESTPLEILSPPPDRASHRFYKNI